MLGIRVAVHVSIDTVVGVVLGQLGWNGWSSDGWGSEGWGSDASWETVSKWVSVGEWVMVDLRCHVSDFIGLSIHISIDAVVKKILCHLCIWGSDVESLAHGEAQAENGELWKTIKNNYFYLTIL